MEVKNHIHHCRYRRPFEPHRVQAHIEGESMTQQSHKDQTDVNAIIARFDRTGQLPQATKQAAYADVCDLQRDLTEAINQANLAVETAREFRKTWKPKGKSEPSTPPEIEQLSEPPQDS